VSDLTPSRLVSPVQAYLERLYGKYAGLNEGTVATYIPELAKADPQWFGICLATIDGQIYEVGDTRQPFTIQSISKPFVYGLALEDVGHDAVRKKIGVEPSGDAFNSISLAPNTGRPLNPMINAGAIVASSLVAGRCAQDKLDRLLAMLSMYAGHPLTIDHEVYASEKTTGHRNRAIGHMLRNFGILVDDPEAALDLYFQQCSVAVDCRDLSLMAATLANGGINPVTGERAVGDEVVTSMLSVMTTCGMYDYAGEWVYGVGMPAKSGVAGGIVAVLPGQLGIGVFSPRLDERGNSVRGLQVCKDLSTDFFLHCLRVPRSARSALRGQYPLSEVSSKRRRNEADRTRLDTVGQRGRVYDLHGDLGFAAIEALIRTLVEAGDGLDFAIIDLKKVTLIEESAAELLCDLLLTFAASDKRVVFAHVDDHSRLMRRLDEQLSAQGQHAILLTFPDLDLAIEWCENRLLGVSGSHHGEAPALSLSEHQICWGMPADAVAQLETCVERRRYDRGALIVRKGDAADHIYLLMSGEVSVTIDLPNGRVKRLATMSPGMTFGEMAVVDRARRSADVRADTTVECCALSTAAFDRLGETHPAIKAAVLENLLRNVSRMVVRLNQEVATLAR
jgi:glutaminase